MSSEPAGVAIVTGAASGIGRSIAIKLAQDGYDVGLFDLKRSEAALQSVRDTIVQTTGRRTASFLGDVSVEADIQGLIGFVVQELGGVDVVSMIPLFRPAVLCLIARIWTQMIANAGIGILKPIEEGMHNSHCDLV